MWYPPPPFPLGTAPTHPSHCLSSPSVFHSPISLSLSLSLPPLSPFLSPPLSNTHTSFRTAAHDKRDRNGWGQTGTKVSTVLTGNWTIRSSARPFSTIALDTEENRKTKEGRTEGRKEGRKDFQPRLAETNPTMGEHSARHGSSVKASFLSGPKRAVEEETANGH